MSSDTVTVRTPAKLILSGEHAVVHGYPALATAINRYLDTTVRFSSSVIFSLHLMGIDSKRLLTLQALRQLKNKIRKRYQDFQSGTLTIRDVLENPIELPLFALINLIDRVKNKLPRGIDITTHSNIPVGCGMGSSAASVIGVTYALSQLLKINFTIEDYIKLSIESENLQHGYSSGLDIQTVYQGGCLRFEKGTKEIRKIQHFPMQIIQTGQPQSTTGECVTHTTPYFKNSSIGKDFGDITNALDQALQNTDIKPVVHCIRENHQLLRQIGVVPDKVHEFIMRVEKQQAAAKICGAGSIRGDAAGIVLVLSEEDITPIATDFGYNVIPITLDTRGTCVI